MVKNRFLVVSLLGAVLAGVFLGNSVSLYAQDAAPGGVASPAGAASAGASSAPPKLEPEYEKDPAYKELGIHTGVFNDGQAALWDLKILDHLSLFGHKERAAGHKPQQPIHFSHILHVQKNKIDCQFCHWSVAKSSYAAIPEVETCMGCHKLVQGHSQQGQADIKKIKEYYEAGKPIPWVKVHVFPDFARFNHKRHVKSGIACSSCHGQVQEMSVVERVSSMKMGWCMDCHREKGASIDCMTCHGSK